MTLLDRLPSGWRQWDKDAKAVLIARLQREVAARRRAAWEPYPWQRPHLHPPERPPGPCTLECLALPKAPPLGALETWLLMGGRGTGKTDGSSQYVLDHIAGPACDPKLPGGHRIAIVAPTLGDAVESCITGVSGLQAYDQRVRHYTSTGGTYVRFANGSRGKLFGAHTPNDVERLRAGGNRCLVWLEEAAAMRQLEGVITQATLGLRVGDSAHFVVSTTPKARPELRKLVEAPGTLKTWGRTKDAWHLPQPFRDALEAKWADTRVGRQELGGEVLEDVEGAMWTQVLIERTRLKPGEQPELGKVVVAVDPNAGGPDEAGIVVLGRGRYKLPDKSGRLQHHGYVLADESDHFTGSNGWARAAVQAYHRWGADAIVAETNNGGDMVGLTVHTVDPSVRYRSVTATRGKTVRAEPVVGLYEQDRMHHVGDFPKLEDQMTTWTDEAGYSPDRMDALVWAATDQLLKSVGGFAGVA
jgi:phage terminase large subunit-like protein